jgi:2-phospho-L-lactate guanylyltransferase
MISHDTLRVQQVRAIVPLKSIKKSKTRLSEINASDRAKLTEAMFRNVLVALRKARRVSDITVVSRDRLAARIARQYGARFLWEGRGHGLNRAVKLAIERLDHEGSQAAMIIHADLPLLKPSDIDKFLTQARGAQIAIAPCKNGTGTNALLLAPPDTIQPVFGEGSYRTHLALARKTGLRYKVLRIHGLQFDLDEPRDFRRLTHYDGLNGTFDFLKKSTNQN